jgi:hypothetical protein
MNGHRVTPEEANRVLAELETRRSLFHLLIDGFCAWPILKFEVASLMSVPPAAARTRRPGAARVLSWALRDLARAARRPSRHYLIKTSTASYTDRAGDRYKDYLVDDLVAVLPAAGKLVTVLCEADIDRFHTALVPDYLTTSLPQLAGALYSRAPGGHTTERIADAMSRVLREDLGLTLCTVRWVRRRLAHFRAQMRAYEWLLARVRPRALLTTDPGEHHVVAAARRLGIPVVELQHGAVWSYHPGYAWGSAAADHRERMSVADRLFVFGEYWKRQLAPNAFWDGRIDVTGSLRLDSYRRARTGRTSDSVLRVLFTTQGFDVSASLDLVAAALSALPADFPLGFTFKLHPTYDRDSSPYTERFAGDPRVRVVGAAEQPATFDLMTESHLHVSIASTCHFEAVALGVPTVVLPLFGSELTRPMLDMGHAFLAADGDELAWLIRNARDLTVAGEASEFYFRSGASANMRHRLEELTGG